MLRVVTVAVSLHQTGGEESTILGWRPNLPQSWTQGTERCAEAGIPAKVKFPAMGQLSQQLIDQARAWGLCCEVVLADAAYGETTGFRQGRESRHLPYALGIATIGAFG